MHSRIVLIGILLMGLLSLGACTKHQAMKGPYEGDNINTAFVDYMAGRAQDRLDLTEAQTTQYRQLVRNLLVKGQELKPQNEALRRDLAASLRKENPTRAEFERFLAAKEEIMRTVMYSGIDDFMAFHATLTPEQRNKLANLVQEMGKDGWRGHGW
jgi:Spy/CpxP family protein refolding chaperone